MIKNDPNPRSNNGQILFDIISRHNLIIANASDKCRGTITRHRSTVDREEEAVLDFILFCDILEPFFNTMLVDEPRHHVLTKYVTKKGTVHKSESDHNVLVSKFKLVWCPGGKKERIETFNYKNKACQLKFKEATSQTTSLSSIFDTKDDLNVATKHFIKRLNGYIHE